MKYHGLNLDEYCLGSCYKIRVIIKDFLVMNMLCPCHFLIHILTCSPKVTFIFGDLM
jgi:hypothetical protein